MNANHTNPAYYFACTVSLVLVRPAITGSAGTAGSMMVFRLYSCPRCHRLLARQAQVSLPRGVNKKVQAECVNVAGPVPDIPTNWPKPHTMFDRPKVLTALPFATNSSLMPRMSPRHVAKHHDCLTAGATERQMRNDLTRRATPNLLQQQLQMVMRSSVFQD